MKGFPKPVALVLLVALVFTTSGCANWFKSEEQQAFDACYVQVKSEESEEFLVENLVEFLDSQPREEWPLYCQKWALLVENVEIDGQIAKLEDRQEVNRAEIERIDDTIAAQAKAEENAAKTATAQVLTAQAPTTTPTLTPDFNVQPSATPSP